MLGKLKEAEARFILTEEKLTQSEVIADTELYKKLMRERKALLPIIEKYREYKKYEKDLSDAQELATCDDRELRELAQEELKASKENLARTEDELKILLLPKDENDDRNVVVEIRAGAGGEEACLFAAVLYRMYGMYSDIAGFKFEPASANETEMGGFREVVFTVSGEGAYSRFKFESGVHRVQRVPETESQGRIHTSTVTVAVLPEAEEVEVEISPADLQIDTYRSGGAGGQHVNKTESAIRITHLPTGTVVECQDERSQMANRKRAMKILCTRLNEAEREKRDAEYAQRRRMQIGGAERSEKIRTYRFQEKIVVDHRLSDENKTMSVLSFLDGDMDTIIDALTLLQQTQRLQNGE